MTNPLRIVPARAFARSTKALGTLPGIMLAVLTTLTLRVWAGAPIFVDSTADYANSSGVQTLPAAITEPWPAAQLAIVIDDLGYDKRRGLEAIALPGRLTVAVMPHTPNARFLAEAAHEAGREIILHHPMPVSYTHLRAHETS